MDMDSFFFAGLLGFGTWIGLRGLMRKVISFTVTFGYILWWDLDSDVTDDDLVVITAPLHTNGIFGLYRLSRGGDCP